MRTVLRLLPILVLAALAVSMPSTAPAANESPIQVIQTYLDNITSGNYESAEALWSQGSLDRANRFGIQYPGIPVRVDAVSPFVVNADKLADVLTQASQGPVMIGPDAQYVKFLFVGSGHGLLLQHWYHLRHEGEWYWLCYPQDAIAHDWGVRESRFFRVHIHPAMKDYVSAASLDQFDRFVESTSDSLGLTKADIALVAAKKIEFYYCNTDSTVLAMTGQYTKGVLDQASNDVISSNFPHHHEVVHLLANIKLRTNPIYTLPVLREGLAVRFGGRWGKGPSALLDLGAFLHRDTLVNVDSTIPARIFENSSETDLLYPVAGVLTSYLWDRLGKQKFWMLYSTLSGPQDSIGQLKMEPIQKTICSALGRKTWPELLTDFNSYIQQRSPSWSAATAGVSGKGKILWSENRNSVSVDGDWINFTVTADSGVSPRQSFFFAKDPELGVHKSMLFEEHFLGSVPFEGYRYGVRIDQNEAGAYDYAGNILTGKFILGINGVDHYYDAKTNVVTVRFKQSLFGGASADLGEIKSVPY